ncbi:DUF3617 family protein [Altererythrobacter sp. KTW20L]|uniref:DUF3617 domain-containing protein n=1 Tax=Altererythrobacter sp. KTW20L TaxID=2942210 RepID=UPI0020C15D90|nr:DUF3617 family protein [Altererythrobacter sp. KTW20L]MCL6249815.1 DUF3617 family protein [Altererythrobacter sp. KTW20L]
MGKLQRRFSVLAAAALLGAVWPASAQAPELAMLETLSKGSWDLRSRADGSHRTICVRTGRELIQLQHRQSGCTSYIVEDSASVVTVQYTCRGDGYGRTTIRRESAGLVQIRSQGTQGGMPFTIEGEARRTGPC